MIDPNVVNYMSFNQPFAGFPPDFNGQPPPAPQQYQHFGFTDYNNNSNNGSNVHTKKSYTKHRRSGSKHDNYKPRNSEIHSIKKNPASNMSNLNSLDITPAQNENQDGKSSENALPPENNQVQPTAQQEIELLTSANPTNDIVEMHPEASLEYAVEVHNNDLTCSDGKMSISAEPKDDGVNKTCDLRKTDSHDSVAVNKEISDAINDRSSIEDESSVSQGEVKESKNDWTVVDSSSDNFVHVNSDGSDHSLSASPEQPCKQSIFSDEEKINQTGKCDLPTTDLQQKVVEESSISSNELTENSSEKEAEIKKDCDQKTENSSEEIINVPLVATDIVKEADDVSLKDATKEISSGSANAHASEDNPKEDSPSVEDKAPSDALEGVVHDSTPPALDFEQKSTITETQNSSSENEEIFTGGREKVSESKPNISDKKADDTKCDSSDVTQNTSDKSVLKSKQNNDANNNKTSKNVDFVHKSDETEKKGQQTSTITPHHSRKASNTGLNEEKKPTDKGLKLSCSSEVVDIEGKEVDVLSESGLSTMSSGSVQSSMSLPPNPLARSTSWADLVRTGKSESPVPPPVYKNPYSSKYQSTPSRYLNHRQAGSTSKYGPNSRNANQPAGALSKSKSLPNQRGLQTNRVVKSKESHVNEEGWSVSSGKSRVKTIPNSCKKPESSSINLARSNDVNKTSATSPKLSLKSSTNSSSTRLKSNDPGSKIKSSDGPEKAKASRSIKPKPATTPSTKNVAAKVNSKPTNPSKASTSSRVSRPLTVASRGGTTAGKPASNKRLVKAKSLESTTNLADNLKLPVDKKNISKSSETLETPCSDDIKTNKSATDNTNSANSSPPVDIPSVEKTQQATNESSQSVEQKPDPTSISSESEQNSSSCVLAAESTDDTDAEGSKASSESKSIQTDASEQAFEDHVEIFAVPASSMYPKLEVCQENVYRCSQ